MENSFLLSNIIVFANAISLAPVEEPILIL